MEYPSLVGTDPVDMQAAAEQAIRSYCQWHVAPLLEETWRLDGTGSSVVHLPTLALQELVTVNVKGREIPVAACAWSNAGMIQLPEATPREFGAVTVTAWHGFENATDIGGIVKSIKDRAEKMPAGVVRKQIGDVGLTYGSLSDRGIALFTREKQALDPYRLEASP